MWENKLININIVYKADLGSFGCKRYRDCYSYVYPKNNDLIEFYRCREEFGATISRRKKLQNYYFVGPKRVSEFLDVVEDRLKLPNKYRTKFGPTNKDNVIWFFPSEWWWAENMRRSLFTIFLRCGNNYYGNFAQALSDYHHASFTTNAIEHFLDGNTHYTGKVVGWYNQFRFDKYTRYNQNKSIKDKKHIDLSKLLVPPSSKI